VYQDLVLTVTAPSRLVLLIPAHSSLLPSLIPPTASSTLTLLTPHPPSLLSYLSKAYLTPVEASPKFWQILETATSRHLGDDLSFKGELDPSTNIIVQSLVRKAAGGSKGISRSLEAFTGRVEKVGDVMEVMPVSNAVGPGGSGVAPKTHADLDLSFNLNLTDSQKAARMGVPLPYAHEGEGAAVDLEIDDEDDEDDEEI
jgi:elongator complex protein 5